MKPRVLVLCTFVLLVAGVAGVAGADTLHLKNGRRFEGRVVRETAKTVDFEIRGIGKQTFNRKDIEKIEKGSSIFDEYDRKKAAIPADDPAALFELGKWCLENGLRKEARRTFRAVIKVSPDHEDARAALGYMRAEGRWLTRKDYQKHREKRRKELSKVLGDLVLGDAHRDTECAVCFCPPKGWKRSDALGGLGTCFLGPKLHGVTLCVGYEVAEPADIAIFKTGVLRELKSDHGEVEVVATGALTDIGGKVAKENVVRYGGATDRAERHDIFFERPEDLVHIWFVCAVEDADALAGLFSEVRSSFKLAVEDSMSGGDMKYELPDVDWERGFGAVGQQGTYETPDFGAHLEVVGHQTHPTFMLIGSRKVTGDAKTYTAEFRRQRWEKSDSGLRLHPAKDKEWTRKVAGQDALVTPFTGTFRGSIPLDGILATFVKDDRMYLVFALNLLGSMGEKYLKQDLNKLLDSLKIG